MNSTSTFKNYYNDSTLPTNRYIHQLDEDSSRRREFEVLFSTLSRIKWSHMLTVTFKKPVTDQITVERFCCEYKKRLLKSLYGVSKQYEQIKIIPFIESHNEIHKGKKKYHVHILLTLPSEMRELISRYQFMFKDKNKLFTKVIEDVLNQMKSSEFVRKRCQVGDQYSIKLVNNTMGVVDYCLKEFRSGRPVICWEGTNNLSF